MPDTTQSSFELRVPICKVDDDARFVFGFVATSTDAEGNLVVDHQGDIIEVAELEKAAYEYVKTSRDLGEMHETSGLGTLVSSVVLTPEIRKAMGVGPGPANWFVGFEITDEAVRKRVKSGELAEFSLEGEAVRVAA